MEQSGDRMALPLASREALRADCSRCVGLCCVALPFTRSADFPFDKPAGEPCRNLEDDHRCRIHAALRDRGFAGCTVFDCFGAGQKVTQHTFAGVGWREDAAVRSAMFEVFPIVRALHELLWLLDEAAALTSQKLRGELVARSAAVAALSALPPGRLRLVDLDDERTRTGPLLRRAARDAQRRLPRGRDLRRLGGGGDLAGAALAGLDLRGAELRGALLIAARLAGSDLRGADLLGADLRDADLTGADLSTAMFVTQPQLNAARGDAATGISTGLRRPAHWR